LLLKLPEKPDEILIGLRSSNARMSQHRSVAEVFVSAVHRRMVMIGTLEKFGVGVLVGSLMAALLVPLASWQALPTFPILLCSALVALLTGSVLTALRWPTRQSAAVEADRQLKLDDLLSSVVVEVEVETNNLQDGFARAVMVMANARCAAHSPSEVIFRRFGMGSWGAIGLAMSVAIALAVVPLSETKSQAIDRNIDVLSSDSNDGPGVIPSTDPARATLQHADPVSEGGSKISNQTEDLTDPVPAEAYHSRGHTMPSVLGTSASTGGAGAATTDHRRSDKQDLGTSAQQSTNVNASPAGGGAAAVNSGQNHETQPGVARGNAGRRNSAWTRSATAEGDSASNDPGIPPERRDLVRDFFDGK
jgi:hypothetical protein